MRTLVSLFRFGPDRQIAWAVVTLFVFIHAIVFYNAIQHDPKIGYDAGGHLTYARVLATGRLPTHDDTHEFFSPPLPYVPAAILMQATSPTIAFKLTQLLQAGYSVVFCLALLALAKRLNLGGVATTIALLLLGSLPTYYRTFAMIRGEPLLIALATLGIVLTLRTFGERKPTLTGGLVLGIVLGLAVISRQWAFFLLPALGLVGLWRLIVDRPNRGATLRAGLITLVAFAVVGMPFYLHLQNTYGSIRAFNREPKPDDAPLIAAEPLGMGEALTTLATRPVRDSFNGHPFMLFYADVWGDYWQYFLIYAKDHRGRYFKPTEVGRMVRAGAAKETNLQTLPAYFGRGAMVGLVPTAIALAGLAAGVVALRRVKHSSLAPEYGVEGNNLARSTLTRSTLTLVSLCTVAGYLWFVLSYPNDNGDTIKSSYPLQIYGPLALLAAAWLGPILQDRRTLGRVVLVLLALVFLHQLGLHITRYPTAWK